MPNYKEVYLKMFQASEKALNIIVAAQQECEELCREHSSPERKGVSLIAENNQGRMKRNMKYDKCLSEKHLGDSRR